MGASDFSQFQKHEDLSVKGCKEAFDLAVGEALHENGHRGYTGSLAEKRSFVFIASCDDLKSAREMAGKLLDDGDDRIDDKWGPAGCIEVKEPKGFLFFGTASS